MPKKKKREYSANRVEVYVKPIDKELFDWAKSQRQSMSEIIALALMVYRKKVDK